MKLSSAGGRLIIASDGIWDALSSDVAAKSCRGLPAELAARQVVKVTIIPSTLVSPCYKLQHTNGGVWMNCHSVAFKNFCSVLLQ